MKAIVNSLRVERRYYHMKEMAIFKLTRISNESYFKASLQVVTQTKDIHFNFKNVDILNKKVISYNT